jgi:hypothetical protein
MSNLGGRRLGRGVNRRLVSRQRQPHPTPRRVESTLDRFYEGFRDDDKLPEWTKRLPEAGGL